MTWQSRRFSSRGALEAGTCGFRPVLPTSFLCFRQLRMGFRSLHARVPDGRRDYVVIASASLHPSGLSGSSRARHAPHDPVPGRRRISHPAIGGGTTPASLTLDDETPPIHRCRPPADSCPHQHETIASLASSDPLTPELGQQQRCISPR